MRDWRDREIGDGDSVVVVLTTHEKTFDGTTISCPHRPTLFLEHIRCGKLKQDGDRWLVLYEGGFVELTKQGCCGFREPIYQVPKVGE